MDSNGPILIIINIHEASASLDVGNNYKTVRHEAKIRMRSGYNMTV